MKQNIIAVDFDGTLCENKWPEIGMLRSRTRTISTRVISSIIREKGIS